jgi:hypothetical protein
MGRLAGAHGSTTHRGSLWLKRVVC